MTEEHIELYKKYRPNTWDELIGIEKLAKSLQSAVKANKLPTSYLLSGPRGCGKTSTALILAKSINCLNIQANANPCNECEVCINIDNGTQLGVNYISMANKGSVDDIRELVQQARLNQPVKKQVWILDEIHTVSAKAFDALLIPLEEKSMPALFIFCTTEISKVPQTIISRVQSRRFALVDSTTMKKHVEEILKKEKIKVSDDLVNDAVRRGRGSVRDTLTVLEEIISTGTSELGFSGLLLAAISNGDLSKCLETIAKATNEGISPVDMGDELFEDLRNLLLSVSGVDPELIGSLSIAPAKVVKGFVSKQGIIMVMDEIGDALTNMAMSADQRIHLEIGIIKSLNRLKKYSQVINNKK